MRASLTGSGPPVVLLHGQPGGARDWERVLPHLRGCAVLAPDRPGYDGTPARGLFGNADAVAALLDAHGIDRAVLAGWSWGGGAALATAMAHPDRVGGLALIGSVGVREALTPADFLLALPGVAGAFNGVMRALGPRLAGLTARANGSVLDEPGMRLLRSGLAYARRGPVWPSFTAEQRALVRETPELERRLDEVAVPAVVLVGRRDATVPPRAGHRLAAALPQGVVREVDAGHLMPVEAPDAVAAAILEAVRRSGLPARS